MSEVLRLENVTKTYTGSPVPAVSDFSLRVTRGEILSFLGPSGCGKTTLLRLIAGFEEAERGRIAIGGRLVADPAAGVYLQPAARRIGFVFQDHALFPHLSAVQNVEFGLPHLPRAKRSEQAMRMLSLVGMTVFAGRSPHQLSGGQQQRVALARALAPEPQLVLLDEPFSSLDAALRASTREEVRQVLRATGTTALLVTHDQEEALGFADRLLLMRAGQLEQAGSPESVYLRPRTAFAASFLGGTNLIRGAAAGASARTPLGEVGLSRSANGQVLLSIRPEMIQLRDAGEPGAPARIVSRVFKGHDLTFTCVMSDGSEQRVTIQTGPECGAAEGDEVRLGVHGLAVPLEGSQSHVESKAGPTPAAG